jgi:hypothetical protein
MDNVDRLENIEIYKRAIQALEQETCKTLSRIEYGTDGNLYELSISGGTNKVVEQEPCEDEYIKVPKKALKYRTAGMVAYNAEWLKNHFDIERAIICGAQEPCEDAISRQSAIDVIESWLKCSDYNEAERHIMRAMQSVLYDLPPVTPAEKVGHWKPYDGSWYECSECGAIREAVGFFENYCPNCGAKMEVEDENTSTT